MYLLRLRRRRIVPRALDSSGYLSQGFWRYREVQVSFLQSTEEGVKFGFYNHPVMLDYKITHVNYGFFESFPAGIKYGWNVLVGLCGRYEVCLL